MTWAKRVDANHGELLAALRACGWVVLDTSRCPGFVDAVGVRRGHVRLFEFKQGKGKATLAQCRLVAKGFPIELLRSVDDCARVR